jgi:hypothetical protein
MVAAGCWADWGWLPGKLLAGAAVAGAYRPAGAWVAAGAVVLADLVAAEPQADVKMMMTAMTNRGVAFFVDILSSSRKYQIDRLNGMDLVDRDFGRCSPLPAWSFVVSGLYRSLGLDEKETEIVPHALPPGTKKGDDPSPLWIIRERLLRR